jgi:hypothetical protein
LGRLQIGGFQQRGKKGAGRFATAFPILGNGIAASARPRRAPVERDEPADGQEASKCSTVSGSPATALSLSKKKPTVATAAIAIGTQFVVTTAEDIDSNVIIVADFDPFA